MILGLFRRKRTSVVRPLSWFGEGEKDAVINRWCERESECFFSSNTIDDVLVLLPDGTKEWVASRDDTF